MSNDLARLAARIAALERRLAQQNRTSRLAYSSIENGALDVYDEDGFLRAVIGQQPDGTTAVNVVNGPPPPQPTAPVLAPAIGGVAVTWDGTFTGAVAAPLDWARVEIHTSTEADFSPGPATLRGTLESPRGGTLIVTAVAPLYVRLLARNTSGTASAASPAAGPRAPGAVGAGDLEIGANGNLVPDPSFETGVVAGQLAGQNLVVVEAGGNDSAHALRIDNAASGSSRSLYYDRFPVTPGDRFWLAADYKVSADYAGNGVLLALRWYDANGTWLSSGVISTTAPTPNDTWRRLTGPLLQAPPSAAYGQVRLQATAGTAGKVWFDNIECRPVFSTATTGARSEISPLGLRLYDEDGDEAVSLITGAPNYLTLRTDGTPVATIDQSGNAAFADLSVAGRLTIAGDPIEALLAGFARGLVAVDYQATAVSASTTDYGFVELSFDADTSRMYRVVVDCYADPSAAGGELVLVLRDGGANSPTISSTQIQSGIYPMAGAGYHRVHLETIRSGWSFGAGLHRLLTTFRVQYGPSGQTVRLLGGGNYPGLMYVEDVGPYIPETGQYNTGGGTTTPPKKTYTKTYAASWSGSYANRGAYNSYYGNQCLQGYYSSTNGMQAALIGFPSSLATDLSGAVIQKAEIYLYFEHWYYNSGGKAVIKAHKHASRPSTFSSDGEAQTITWGKNVGKWVDITAVFDSTSWRGIALDPNNSDRTYYGRAQGVGQTYPPQLRVTYTK
ncbi:hypothetical protein [Streptomyces sp. NPDC058084]|uniref:hypothetical protein n=1 Tax=Streptomyces sp. NPDC058084 TaxID=3346333 RepID=UPI0036EFB2EC